MTVVQLNPANQALAARLTATPKTKTVLALDLAAMNLTYPTMLAVGKVLDLSTNVVERARGLLRYANPDLLYRVRSGQVSMNAALLEAFPNKAAGHRARRAPVIHALTPNLISTQRLTDEVHRCGARF